MKKYFLISLAIIGFGFYAQSQTKEETERWLAEKLYAFNSILWRTESSTVVYEKVKVVKVEVVNCLIVVYMEGYYLYPEGRRPEEEIKFTMTEAIPISSSLTCYEDNKGNTVYKFYGKIFRMSTLNESDNWWIYRFNSSCDWFEKNASSSAWLKLANMPDDMLERIKKALEHYKTLCGVNDEPF